jgi:hypothetical protein
MVINGNFISRALFVATPTLFRTAVPLHKFECGAGSCNLDATDAEVKAGRLVEENDGLPDLGGQA